MGSLHRVRLVHVADVETNAPSAEQNSLVVKECERRVVGMRAILERMKRVN